MKAVDIFIIILVVLILSSIGAIVGLYLEKKKHEEDPSKLKEQKAIRVGITVSGITLAASLLFLIITVSLREKVKKSDEILSLALTNFQNQSRRPEYEYQNPIPNPRLNPKCNPIRDHCKPLNIDDPKKGRMCRLKSAKSRDGPYRHPDRGGDEERFKLLIECIGKDAY